jgi:hypothetical protein
MAEAGSNGTKPLRGDRTSLCFTSWHSEVKSMGLWRTRVHANVRLPGKDCGVRQLAAAFNRRSKLRRTKAQASLRTPNPFSKQQARLDFETNSIHSKGRGLVMQQRRLLAIALFIALIALAGCGKKEAEVAQAPQPETQQPQGAAVDTATVGSVTGKVTFAGE